MNSNGADASEPLVPGPERASVQWSGGNDDGSKRRLRAEIIAKSTITILGVVCLFLAFFFTFDVSADTSSTGPIRYWHGSVVEADVERGDAPVMLTATRDDGSRALNVTLFHANSPTPAAWTAVAMEPNAGTYYFTALPVQPINTNTFYYIAIADGRGNAATIPANAPQPPLLYKTFQHTIPPALLGVHIGLVLAAMIIVVHSLMYSLFILTGGADAPTRPLRKLVWSLAIGWIIFFITFVPIGCSVNHAAFGVTWGGWPFGIDFTDTKSEILLLYFLVVVLLRIDVVFKRDADKNTDKVFQGRGMAWWTIGGIILTGAVNAIPHQYFVQ